MRPLDSFELLQIWEYGLNQPLVKRMLTLLAAATDTDDIEKLSVISIGERDYLLLLLREMIFGPQLRNNSSCPRCGERVEWENLTKDFHHSAPNQSLSGKEFTLIQDSYTIVFRLPNSLDLLGLDLPTATDQPAEEDPGKRILKNCVIRIDHPDIPGEVEQLPQTVISALESEIEKLDPLSQIQIDLHCPKCSNRWQAIFDIAYFFWQEIEEWAERMLHCVHQLAGAYGWSEEYILRLNPVRRELYLGMVTT